MVNYVIETQGLYKRFEQVTALENINIKIKTRRICRYYGSFRLWQNYLMNILTCLDTASEGKVILDGIDVAKLTK